MDYFDFSTLNLAKANVLGNVRILTAMVTVMTKWHRGPPATKM